MIDWSDSLVNEYKLHESSYRAVIKLVSNEIFIYPCS